MRTKAALAVLLCSSALMLSACGNSTQEPAGSASLDATAGASEDALDSGPAVDASGTSADAAIGQASQALDTGALAERNDPERVLRYYISAIRTNDWTSAAKAWGLDAQMTPQKLEAELGGAAGAKLAVGKGDMEGAAGSLYYEAPLVVDFGDGRPSKRGTIVLRRVNDVPGASEEQLNWRIERTSTLTQ